MTKDKHKGSEFEEKEEVEKEKEDNKSKKEKEHYIYAKVSDHTREIIDKLKEEGKTISYIIQSSIDIYNIYHSSPREIKDFVAEYQKDFGGQKELVIEAIKRLEARYHREKATDEILWERARDEMNVMLVGKKFITQFIGIAEASNYALDDSQIRILSIDPILWFVGKPLKELSLEEFLNAIKKIWTVFNYFNMIEIKKESGNIFYVMLNHRQNKSYSTFWLNFCKRLFKLNDLAFNCDIDGEAYEETLSIKIKLLL